MKAGRHIRTAAHWTSMSAVAVALLLTRNCGQPKQVISRFNLVDERLFQTTESLGHLASTSDERRFSDQAIKMADQELDLAYSMGVREALEHPVAVTPEAKELYARVSRAEAQLKADQEQVSQFTSHLAQASSAQQSAVQTQLDVLKAQLQLDQDDLDDAKKDLERSGVDKVSRIQARWQQHKDQHASQAQSSDAPANPSEAGYDARNLVAQVAAWYALSSKTTPLRQVREQTQAGAIELMQHQRDLEMQAAQLQGETVLLPGKKLDSSETVTQLLARQRLESAKRTLDDLGQRIQDRQEIGITYGNWIELTQTRGTIAMFGALRSTLWILLIVMATPLAARTLRAQMAKRRSPDPELANLGTVGGFAVQASGVLLCLLVIFGFPQQLPTAIIGIVGAGVTVAVKDFAGVVVDKRIRGLLNAEAKPGAASASAGASS